VGGFVFQLLFVWIFVIPAGIVLFAATYPRYLSARVRRAQSRAARRWRLR
jgi:hypothetical protein